MEHLDRSCRRNNPIINFAEKFGSEDNQNGTNLLPFSFEVALHHPVHETV